MIGSAMGLVHVVFAFVAMAAGGVVFVLAKGTRWHRTLGHVYATAMAGVTATSFGMYDLTGGFGPFHVAAVAAGVTLAVGLAAALLRRPRGRWLPFHARWMVGSYIGLMCAFAAETTSRWILPLAIPRLPQGWIWPTFWVLVVGSSLAMGFAGGWLSSRYLAASLARTPGAMRAERTALLRAERETEGAAVET